MKEVVVDRVELADGTVVDVLDGTRFGAPVDSGEDY